MKKNESIAVLFGVFSSLLLSLSGAHASIVFQESFENAPGTTYTLTTAFDDGSFDYFDRYAVPDNANAARDDFQTGWHGAYGIQGQDLDGDGGSPMGLITIAGIDISGAGASPYMFGSFGALNSEPSFQNFEAVDGDGIGIFATIDAGSRIQIGRFSPPASGAGDLYLDPDFDGVGSGTGLTVDLADFAFALPGGGSSLTLEIEITSTSSFESIALDNIRVSTVIPEPSTFALFGLGSMALVLWRKAR